jgi:hypothetical protein
MDFYRLGQRISPEISGLMNKMHQDQPNHGYRPIAWHRVFWDLTSDYQNLRLELKMHDPYCQVDDDLCTRIETYYQDVVATSRPVISRRRTSLEKASTQVIVSRFKEKFGLTLTVTKQRKPARLVTFEDQ